MVDFPFKNGRLPHISTYMHFIRTESSLATWRLSPPFYFLSYPPSSLSWKPERGGTKKQSNRREPWPFKHQQGSEGSFHPHHQPKLAYEDPAIAIQVPAVTTPRQASPCTSHRSRPTSAMTAGHIPSPHQSILMLSRLNCHLFLNSAFTQNERTPFEKLPEKYFRPGEFFPFVCVCV